MPEQNSKKPNLGPKKPKKNGGKPEPPKVVVVSEGLTELDYMEAISCSFRKKYIYKPYERQPFDIDLTDKYQLLDLLDAHVRYMQGHVTPFCYATQTIRELILKSKKRTFDQDEKKTIWSFRQSLVSSMIKSDAVDKNGFVTNDTQIDADAACMDVINNNLPKCIQLFIRKNSFYANINLSEDRPLFKADDCALLMFDRDYWEIQPIMMSDEDYEKQSHESYRHVIERCMDLDYVPVLTTPLFEFWLLLHHNGEIGDAKSYKMDLGSSKKQIQKLLRKLEKYEGDGKKLSEERRVFYAKSFAVAFDVSKELENDPISLIHNSGTNVGVVVKELMDGIKPSSARNPEE